MRRSEQRKQAVFVCYREDLTKHITGEGLSNDGSSKSYSKEIVLGVAENLERIDELISKYSRGWSLERIAPLEKCIMRVALYEIIYRDDIPFEVAIDEAIELAKRYCGADAPGFINGILGSALKEVDEEDLSDE